MAFKHGKLTKVFLEKYDISGFLNNAELTRDKDNPEVTTFGNDDRKHITGLRGGTMSMSGFWSGTSALAIDALTTLLNKSSGDTALNLTYAPYGAAVGNVAYSVQTLPSNFTITSPVDGAVGVSIDTQSHDVLSRGACLHQLTARTSDGNGTAHNLGANTSEGARAYLHVTSITLAATDSIAVTVQDSATCSAGSWSDLITFTNITCDAMTHRSQRQTTSTGNIDQYVRAEWDHTGGGASSITFTINFEQL